MWNFLFATRVNVSNDSCFFLGFSMCCYLLFVGWLVAAIYYALFEEVTVAKSLLEQIALVSQGRPEMYQRILVCIDAYIQQDLTQITIEPSVLLSQCPMDDPLEDILYLTSVGEPGTIYGTVKSLRQARAKRLGALQQKLPPIQMALLYALSGCVLFTFPLLGAGSQTLGGYGILQVQAVYLAFISFGISLVLGVINELRLPNGNGAYNVGTVLNIMVSGLREELEGRMNGTYSISAGMPVNYETTEKQDSIDTEP